MKESAPAHTRVIFDTETFPSVVDWIVETVKQNRFDALAASGHSGLLVAAAAAYVLHIPVLAVRKHGEVAKGDDRRVNGVLRKAITVYAFVDDVIGTGDTLRNAVDRIREAFEGAAVCRGVLLYNIGEWSARNALMKMDAPTRYESRFSNMPLFTKLNDHSLT